MRQPSFMTNHLYLIGFLAFTWDVLWIVYNMGPLMLCKILKRRRVQFFEVLRFWRTMSNIYMELMWCVILFACSEDSLKLQWFSCLFTTSPYPVYTVKMLMKWFEHRLLWVSTLSGEVMRVEEVFSLHWLKLLSLLVWRKTGDLSWLQVGWWSILIFVGKFCILSSLLIEASWADFGLLQF